MSELLLVPIITGPIFIVTGYFLFRYPPSKINGLYGYRTSSSMKSIERWKFAQVYSAKEMMKAGLILTLSAALGFFIDLSENEEAFIGLGIMLVAAFLLIFRVEKALKAKFGK